MQRRQTRVATIRVRTVFEKKERHRHLGPDRGDEQRRRSLGSSRRKGAASGKRLPAVDGYVLRIRLRLRSHIDIDARGQQETRALDIAFPSREVQRGEAVFRAGSGVGLRLDQ